MWRCLAWFLLAGSISLAQVPGQPGAAPSQRRIGNLGTSSLGVPGSPNVDAEKDLPRFDLDFPGGTPIDLVAAIREQIGTLNAIVPEKDQADRIPAFKVKGVNVAELFRALQSASQRTVTYQTGVVDYGGREATRRSVLQQTAVMSGFQTQGALSPEAVWYYYATNEPKLEATVCRFYQLASFLTTYKVDDITTAVQAGWRMLGEKDTPQLNYHEDTKLLIAVGSPDKLEMIDAVLSELNKGKTKVETTPPASATTPKNSEK